MLHASGVTVRAIGAGGGTISVIIEANEIAVNVPVVAAIYK